MRTPRSGLWWLTLASAALACSVADDRCRCLVQTSTTRLALACGESACVDARSLSCADRDQLIERGSCPAAPAPGEVESVPNNGALPAADAQSCQRLLAYCAASCTAPAATGADCQATASAGDPTACQNWPVANAVLCRP